MKLAIVGGGWVTENCYLPHLQAGSRFSVRAVIEPDAARAASLVARLPQARVLPFEAALHEVDAILLAHPSQFHVRDARAALVAGVHVLCEKPIAADPAHIDQLEAAARAGGARFVPARVCRHRVDVAHWEYGTRRIGQLSSISLAWRRHRGVPAASWHLRRSGGMTGALADLGHHLLDLAAWVGPVDAAPQVVACRPRVAARVAGAEWYGASSDAGCEVHVACELELDWGGLPVRIDVAWTDDEPGDCTLLEARGLDGSATLRGLFGFSPERRFQEQRVAVLCRGRQEQRDFVPGPDLHRSAFAGVLAELADGGDAATTWPQLRAIASVLRRASVQVAPESAASSPPVAGSPSLS